MENIKVCVYAICKNEEKFIDRWMASVSEADYVAVLDTGSTDNSLEKLKSYPAIVKQELIVPWRFDTARNKALSLVPDDASICVSVDMDEVLLPGWHEKLISAWTDDTTAAQCRFVWHFNEDGSEGGVFWPIRIHHKSDYTWTHSIHEVLNFTGDRPQKVISIPDIQFNHLPDVTKSRDYLSLLKNAVNEDPHNARDLFYLGREYLYHREWQPCIQTLNTYLTLSKWNEERCAAYRFIAKAYIGLKQNRDAVSALKKAVQEAPYIRESFIDLAAIYYAQKDWQKTAYYIDKSLKIPMPSHGFINEGYAWDATPYDYGSIAHFHLRHYELSLAYATKCLEYSPEDTRFADNVKFIQNFIISRYLDRID